MPRTTEEEIMPEGTIIFAEGAIAIFLEKQSKGEQDAYWLVPNPQTAQLYDLRVDEPVFRKYPKGVVSLINPTLRTYICYLKFDGSPLSASTDHVPVDHQYWTQRIQVLIQQSEALGVENKNLRGRIIELESELDKAMLRVRDKIKESMTIIKAARPRENRMWPGMGMEPGMYPGGELPSTMADIGPEESDY